MLPVTCEERKQKVLILSSSEEFTIFVANTRHVRAFQYSKF